MRLSHSIKEREQRRISRLSARVVVFAFAVVATLGCGEARPTRVLVSGKVLLDGKPLANCEVQFASPGGRSSFGQTDDQGRFTLGCYEENDGVLPGTHQAVVVAKQDIDGATMRWLAPKKYIDYKTSGLEYVINQPTDDLVIDLTWAGDKPFTEINGRRVKR